MSTADVLQFSCLAPNPLAHNSAIVRCDRQRWHGGDHRAYVAGRMFEWADPPAPPQPHQEAAMAFGDRHRRLGDQLQPPRPDGSPYLPLPLLDEQTETYGVSTQLEGHVVPAGMWAAVPGLVQILCIVASIVACCCAPAIVLAVWRLAL